MIDDEFRLALGKELRKPNAPTFLAELIIGNLRAGRQAPPEYAYPAGQAYCASATLDVPATKAAAIAKVLNLVGITTSAKCAKERQSAACSGERRLIESRSRGPAQLEFSRDLAAWRTQARYDARCGGAHPQ